MRVRTVKINTVRMKTAKSNSRNRRPQRSGMTLIEIMIVLVILVTVMAFAVGAFFGQRDRANRLNTYNYINVLKNAIERYEVDVGQPPTTEQGLAALIDPPSDLRNPANWAGEYISRSAVSTDVWGNEIQYRSPGEDKRRFDIFSVGPDGIAGTDDDIGSWMPESDFR